jgi:hypothetical protein
MSTSGRNPTVSELGGPCTHDDHSKVAKPDIFKGQCEHLKEWLLQLDLYFAFNPVEARKKTLFATMYMWDRAQQWIKPELCKFLNDGTDKDDLFANFAEFKKSIHCIFGVSNEESTVIWVIQHLQQRTSASEYAAKFQEYLSVTKWDDAALMTMFHRGLKENVKDELMCDGQAIMDLEDLIEVAIDLDNKLYKWALKKCHNGEPSQQGQWGGHFHKNTHQTSSGRACHNPFGPAPMELNSTQHKPKGKHNQSRVGDKNTKTCYAYGKPGHFVRDCHSKNKVQQQQFNMVMQKEENREFQGESDSKKP